MRWLPSSCILHHGEHEQYRLTVFCPRLYFAGALATWQDPELFKQLDLSLAQAKEKIRRSFPLQLQRRYPWGFRKKSRTPVWLCLFETQETVEEGTRLDIILPILHIESAQSHVQSSGFHVTRNVAADHGTAEHAANLASNSYHFCRHRCERSFFID